MTTTTATTTTIRRTIPAEGPFSLAVTGRFLQGMLAITSRPTEAHDHLHLAFVPDGRAEGAVGACIRPARGGVTVDLVNVTDERHAAPVFDQVARILSLDVDARHFPEAGERDTVVGDLQRRFAGLRPMNFLSPYEAGAKFLIGHRMRMNQAGAIKQRLSLELGEPVTICDEVHHGFPGPARLAGLGPTRGIPERTGQRLRALARAALTTDLLDGATIRSKPAADAIAALQTLPGVGPFTAEGIVLRGAGAPDVLTLHEPRLAWAVQRSYGLATLPTDEELIAISEPWRPFRTWVTVLLRVALEADTHEIATGQRPAGGLARGR